MEGERRIALGDSVPPPDPGRTPIDGDEAEQRLSVTLYLRDRGNPTPAEVPAPMSREEYAAAHGAHEDDLRAVERFAGRYGLTIDDVDRAARRVRLSGTVAELGEAFGVQSQRYHSRIGTYRSHDGPITLPPDVAGRVDAVLGLDTRPVARPGG